MACREAVEESQGTARKDKLKQLEPGTMVRVQHHLTMRWDLIGTITEVKPRGPSYRVRSEAARLCWRNRKFIMKYFLSDEDKDDNLMSTAETLVMDPSRASGIVASQIFSSLEPTTPG